MIRGNYSLANDQRKFEKLQQSKVQNRQKRAHMMAKLEKADPARIRSKMIALEQNQLELLARDKSFLASLREDWKFIRRNNLHLAQVEAVLLREKHDLQRKAESAAKLWGKQSVYFNPELNPLGKVPSGMKNIVISEIGRKKTQYPTDSIIEQIGVVMPAGDPPKFYKEVQNYDTLERRSDIVEGTEKLNESHSTNVLVPSQVRKKRRVETEEKEEEEKEEEEDEAEEDEDEDGEEEEKEEEGEQEEINHDPIRGLDLAYDTDSDDDQ